MYPSQRKIFLKVFFALLFSSCSRAWTALPMSFAPFRVSNTGLELCKEAKSDGMMTPSELSRRSILQSWIISPGLIAAGLASAPSFALAADTSSAEVTDRVFVTIKGLQPASEAVEPKRIVIGLFGKDAPESTVQLKKLLSNQGLVTPCRPRAERTLQKEQLEANKVYNGCKETEDVGINLKYSTVWRIIKDERIDCGAVTGRFLAREYPDWKEATSSSALKHDTFGTVSVRRGNDGGFGFSIYSGEDGKNSQQLDEDHIVIGRVVEGLDVVRALNEIPVVASSKVNYMGLTGGPKTNNAPDRSCRYGGPMYCNENKPLVKLSITETGIL